MRFTLITAAAVLPALALAHIIPDAAPSEPQPAALASTLSPPQVPAAVQTAEPTAVQSPHEEVLDAAEESNVLELRQATGQATAATLAATQAGTVTTQWIESTIGSTTTWVEVIYTQTFASVPDQMTTAGAGSIGLGTITGTVGAVRTDEAKSGAQRGMEMGVGWAAAAALLPVVGLALV